MAITWMWLYLGCLSTTLLLAYASGIPLTNGNILEEKPYLATYPQTVSLGLPPSLYRIPASIHNSHIISYTQPEERVIKRSLSSCGVPDTGPDI